MVLSIRLEQIRVLGCRGQEASEKLQTEVIEQPIVGKRLVGKRFKKNNQLYPRSKLRPFLPIQGDEKNRWTCKLASGAVPSILVKLDFAQLDGLRIDEMA